MLDEENEKYTINMLLDPENYTGEHEGRLGPLLIFLGVAAAPALLYMWLFYGLLPLWLVLPVYIIYVIRIAFITLGREKERLAEYKKQLNDDYASMYDLVSIKTLHPDGCCEYIGNKVAYFVVTTNKTSYNDVVWAAEVMEFLKILSTKYEVDIYVQNITEVKSLDNRYKGVKLFKDNSVAKDFMDIVDNNRSQVYQQSLLTRTVWVVRGPRSDWEEIKKACNQAIYSSYARIFKTVHLANDEEVNEILSRDVNGLINLPEVMQAKYKTQQYFGSKVLAFDNADVKEETTQEHNQTKVTKGFMSSLAERSKK